MYLNLRTKLLILICCFSISFISCDSPIIQEPEDPNTENPSQGEDDDEEKDEEGEENGEEGGKEDEEEKEEEIEEEAMSPLAQKQYLESIGIQFLEYFNLKKFQELTDLLSYSHNTYKNYSWDNASSWASKIFQDLIENAENTTETDENGNINYYNNSTVLIMASNFHSHFTAQNNSWVRSDGSDLQFQFKDQYNQDCILKLSTSGDTKKVHVANFDDWYDSDYNSYSNIYSNYYDRTQLTIGVPEQITLTLTCGEKLMLKEIINIDLSSITNNKFDVAKNNLNLNTTIDFYNGYKFELVQASYTPKHLLVDLKLLSNGKTLFEVTASSDINDIPSINLEDFSSSSFDEDDYDFINISAKNLFAKINILGKVQVQGAISEVNKYVEYLISADANNSNESNFKSYINQANSLSKLHLHYNETKTIHASVQLEPFVKYGYNGEYWYYEPVFLFYDGSSYCSLEAFFYDADFKKLLDAFEQIIEDYSNKFDI